MKIELHCHTNISDCPLSIDEVLELALVEGVTHLAITNHDTTEGLEEAIEKERDMGLRSFQASRCQGLILKEAGAYTFSVILSNLVMKGLKRFVNHSLTKDIAPRKKWLKD